MFEPVSGALCVFGVSVRFVAVGKNVQAIMKTVDLESVETGTGQREFKYACAYHCLCAF